MRHGHSPSISEAGVATDAARPLSERGRAGSRATAEDLLKRGGKPGLILHSPLARAVQTADEAAQVLNPSSGRRVFEPLSNVLPPQELLRALEPELEKAGELLAVGHQPQIGELAMLLADRIFDFQPGGLVALELDGKGRCAVLWSWNP